MPSTMPMPEGVGEMIKKRYASEKPAMMVPAENGTSKDKNEQHRININKPLSSMPHKTGRMRLDFFSVNPEKPSAISCAN